LRENAEIRATWNSVRMCGSGKITFINILKKSAREAHPEGADFKNVNLLFFVNALHIES
jgi:hypothetical protein